MRIIFQVVRRPTVPNAQLAHTQSAMIVQHVRHWSVEKINTSMAMSVKMTARSIAARLGINVQHLNMEHQPVQTANAFIRVRPGIIGKIIVMTNKEGAVYNARKALIAQQQVSPRRSIAPRVIIVQGAALTLRLALWELIEAI